MYCPQCRNPIPEDSTFCPNCGTQLNGEQYSSPVQTTNGTSYSRPLLRTDRSLTKFILLGIITLGIYDIVVMVHIAQEINIISSKHDGKHTMHYLLMLLLLILTLGIAGFVWHHRISNRIGDELKRRGIDYHFSAEDYWLWGVLVSMILPFAAWYYNYKLLKAMNLINDSYNRIG